MESKGRKINRNRNISYERRGREEGEKVRNRRRWK